MFRTCLFFALLLKNDVRLRTKRWIQSLAVCIDKLLVRSSEGTSIQRVYLATKQQPTPRIPPATNDASDVRIYSVPGCTQLGAHDAGYL